MYVNLHIGVWYVCVCICRIVHLNAGIHELVEAREQPCALARIFCFVLDKASLLLAASVYQGSCPIGFWEFSAFHLSIGVLGLQMHTIAPSFYRRSGHPNSDTPHLHSKGFTHWAISPSPDTINQKCSSLCEWACGCVVILHLMNKAHLKFRE